MTCISRLTTSTSYSAFMASLTVAMSEPRKPFIRIAGAVPLDRTVSVTPPGIWL